MKKSVWKLRERARRLSMEVAGLREDLLQLRQRVQQVETKVFPAGVPDPWAKQVVLGIKRTRSRR